MTNIGFNAVSSFGGDPTGGNFLDAIQVELLPFVELTKSTFATREGTTIDLPAVQVLGIVPAGGMNISVNVTGGTALLGSRYTTPNGTTTFTVNIPAGDYGSGQSFPLGFLAPNDGIPGEPDQTVQFSLVNQPADYLIQSIEVCGGTPLASGVWTIREDGPSLQLTKTGTRADTNGDGVPSAGDIITYAFALTNTGSLPLTNITLSDALAGLNITGGPIASLAVGATNNSTFTGTYTVTAADMIAGNVTNTAQAQAVPQGGGNISSNTSQVVIPLTTAPAVDLTKSGTLNDNNRGFAAVGDIVTYSFLVRNTGNVPLTNVTITDNFLTGPITGSPIANLAVGASATLTKTYAVTQTDINNGSITNTATVSGTPPTGPDVTDSSTKIVPVVQAPLLSVTKSAGAPSGNTAGSTILYTFTVRNTGNVALNTIAITDPQVNGVANCIATTLAVNAQTTCTGTHIITQTEVDSGSVSNTARATGRTPSNQPVTSPPASTSTTLPRNPALSIVKNVDRTTIAAPGNLTYTIIIRNTGNVSLTGVSVGDVLPNGSAAVLAAASETGAAGGTAGVLDVGETWTYTLTYAVTQAMINAATTPAASTLTNVATVSTTQTPAPASDDAKTTINRMPSFTTDKVVDLTTISAAGTLNYTVTLTNTGNVPLTNVTPVDTLPDGTTGTLAGPNESITANNILDVGEVWTYTISFTVTQARIEQGGNLVNTVSVTTTETPSPQDSATTTITQFRSLTVDKQVDQMTITAPGTLNYTVVVTNTGNVALTNVVYTDTLPNGTSGTLIGPVESNPPGGIAGQLDIGETWTYTLAYAVDQPAIDTAANLVNTVTVSADNTPPVSDIATTVIDDTPGMLVEKTVDRQSIAVPGTLTYTIKVSNTGNQTLTNLTPDDTLPNGSPAVLPLPMESVITNNALDIGETWTYTVTYAVTQAEIDAGTDRVNTVTFTSTETPAPTPPATATTTIAAMPSLSVDKTVDKTSVAAPGTLNYTIIVSNTGNRSLTGVVAADTLPDGTPATLTGPAESNPPGGSANVLDVGETWTYTATYAVTQADIDAGADRVNSVSVTSTQTPTPAVDTATTTITQMGALHVDKFVDKNSVSAPDTLTYTIEVHNTGNIALTPSIVPPAMVDTLSNGATPTVSGPTESLPGGTPNVLDFNEVWTYTATYNVTQADINAGTALTNTATATFTQPGGGTVTGSGTANTTIAGSPGLTLVKTATAGNPYTAAGDIVTYSYAVTNSGNTTITQPISINDNKIAAVSCPALPAGGLIPTATLTCTASYTIVQADINAGSVTNRATATDGTTTSPPDDATVNATQTPGLTLVKTATAGNPYAAAGDIVTYSYAVTNSGNTTITQPISVNDNKIAAVSCPALPAGGLIPTATLTCTASYTIVQADINAGSVTNTATATDGTITSPPGDATVTATRAPALTVVKSSTAQDTNANGVTDAGDTIVYAFRVENTGNITLVDVMVSDALAGVVLTGGPIATLAPGGVDTTTYSGLYVLTQADVNRGSVTNTATATGTDGPGGPPVTSPPSDVTTPVTNLPSITLAKTAGGIVDANGDGRHDVGDTVTYSFVARNTGNVTLTGVELDDARIDVAGLPISPSTLAPGQSGTATATYALTQADFDAGKVDNRAVAKGTPPSGPNVTATSDDPVAPGPSDPTTIIFKGSPSLAIGKTVDPLSDGNRDGLAGGAGDTLTYHFQVTNTGTVTLQDVVPVDAGPSFNGRPASDKLSAFTPPNVPSLKPGDTARFTATYVLSNADADAAAGVRNGIKNTAIAHGYADGGAGTGTLVVSPQDGAFVTLPLAAPGNLTITKQAGVRQIHIGEKAPFTIVVQNNLARKAGPVTVVDTIPSGFRFVDGSAKIDGVAATPEVAGRQVIFKDIILDPNGKTQIRLLMQALSTAGPGRHTNKAVVTDDGGAPLAPAASAWVEILAEPVFDCGEIIGKVFDDLNRNGYQDEGEPGLPGVRVVTVRGLLITTDQYGRFHVACADMPDKRIGSNFVMKLDERTLPTGYRITTENPRAVRLTAGKMTKLNFGASIGRVVRLDLRADAFEAKSTALKKAWQKGLDQLIAELDKEPSVLRLSYFETGGDRELGKQRMRDLEEEILKRWEAVKGRYRLGIETRMEAGQ